MGIRRITGLWKRHWQQIRCLQKQLLFVLRVKFRNHLITNMARGKPGFESPWGRHAMCAHPGSGGQALPECPKSLGRKTPGRGGDHPR